MRNVSRRSLLGLSLAGLTSATIGCAPTGKAEAGAESTPADTGFPAKVKHKYGTIEIPARPERIVSVGYTEHDAVLALGLKPVAVTEWYGEQPYATWPWARDELGDAKPEVLSSADGLQFEQIGALAPDLILGTNAGLTRQDYDKLSKLAPTIANSGAYDSDWFEPWPDQTLQIGRAVGMEKQAAELINSVKKQYADAAAANPHFADLQAIFLQAPYSEGAAIAYQKGLGTDFLTDLGFDIPSQIDPFVREAAQAYIPVEKLDVLNSGDVLIWATEDDQALKELRKNKLFDQLTAVKEGRSIYTGAELAGAIYFSTVLSLPYVLDKLVPQLVDALPK